jgi:hypothetical protein
LERGRLAQYFSLLLSTQSHNYYRYRRLISVSKGNLSFEQGQGVIATKDGSETANYTLIDVFNGTDFLGAQAYSTNSTGGLSFLNNILGIIKGEQDDSGNYAAEHWHWK